MYKIYYGIEDQPKMYVEFSSYEEVIDYLKELGDWTQFSTFYINVVGPNDEPIQSVKK